MPIENAFAWYVEERVVEVDMLTSIIKFILSNRVDSIGTVEE